MGAPEPADPLCDEETTVTRETEGETDPGTGPEPEAVGAARRRLRGRIHRTPLLSATLLGRLAGGVRLFLKAENLQKTGSFKVRGVLSKLLGMSEVERARGAVTVSAGNHAQALAWGASSVGVDATVVMPETAPRAKVAACRDYGAGVVLEGDVYDAFERALAIAEEEGRTFVHPFDDPDIIAGQATVGEEIVEDAPELDAVVVPVGGGGLVSGVATALKRARPEVRVFGVEPEGAASMRRSLETGEPVRIDRVDTVADGLGSPMAGDLTYPIVRRHVEDVLLVTDEEIESAIGPLLTYTKLLAEPAGGAGVAALLAGKVPVSEGAAVAAVLSGGNVDLDRVATMIGGSE